MTKGAEIWRGFRYHSRTFSAATLLLPWHLRQPVAVLYMFCRHIDEIADNQILRVGKSEAERMLRAAEENLENTLSGAPPAGPMWKKLHGIHRRFGLNRKPMLELISGARWDTSGRPVTTMDELIAYSDLVGGSIGAMMLPLLGSKSMDDVETPARSIGIAMQITNILRDVGEDRRRLGRTYVPTDLSAGFAVDLESIAGPTPSYVRLTERMMAVAEDYYERGMPGIRHLPSRARRGILAATRMYREILNEIRANGYDNLSRRAYVPPLRKAAVILRDDYSSRRHRLKHRNTSSGR